MKARLQIHAPAVLLALWALSAPPSSHAQSAPPPEVQQLLQEAQAIQERLRPIHQQALQDPAIQEEQEQINAAVVAAMVQADPATQERLDRMRALVEEAQAAQENGDEARLAEILAQVQALHPALEQAQSQAIERPEIASRIGVFRERLHARMAQIDPEAPALLARLEELERRILQAVR